ncbi:hypothetical protein [Trichloromonas sp.]|uniref:hypothetical protein n=1 Tax=Trichloromonas sp. TaxID=3069249 RepID=UPI003D812B86
MANPKKRFFKAFKKHFFLRFHMSLILLATGLCGLLGSKFLIWRGVENLLIRFPLNVLIAYLCFFLFVKIWLWYISPSRSSMDAADALDYIDPWSGSSGSSSTPSFVGGKGSFGGGGASGDFGDGGLDADGGAGSGLLGHLDIDLDGDACWPLLILGVILLLVFGAGFYLIYQGPVILAEAAFEFLLASGMIRRFRRMDDPDWLGSVFRMTWLPFVLVLLIATLCAWQLQVHFPEVVKLSDLF